MARASRSQGSFNGGELSPRLFGRTDQAVYFIGAAEMLGWIPVLQGPAVAAPGTRFVEVARGPFRLIPFEFNVTQGYQIEASANIFRFFTNDVRIETAPGIAYQIDHPYSYAQLQVISYQQSLDVLYLVGGGVAPNKLERLGAETFQVFPWQYQNGPFEDENGDDAVVVSASGVTGTVTLTCNIGIWAASDVGGLFKLGAQDFADIPAWEPQMAVGTLGGGPMKVRSAGKVYQDNGGSGTTGAIAPVHDRGIAWDGMDSTDITATHGPFGQRWLFLYGPIGIVRITGFTSATSVTAEVLSRLADSLTTVASPVWAHGSFSDTRGYPDAIAIWNNRTVLGKDSSIYGSVVGGYDDFSERDSSGNAQRDLAFRVRLPDPNPIRWLAADTKLLIGTAKAEYAAEQLPVQNDAAGPPPIQIKRQSAGGTQQTRPILTEDGRLLFVQRAGRKILELGYSIDVDRFKPVDVTARAEHVGLPGFVEMAWAQEPEALIWAVRGDGSLACMTYSASEQVHSWARRELGGGLVARTISTNTDPAGKRDQVWIGAQFGLNWWVLRMEKIWETGDPPASAFFLDAGLTYSGVPTASGSAAAHLANQQVSVLADGKPHPDITISAIGGWTLQYPAATVQLGFPYPARLTTLPIEAGAEDGSAQGKIQRISSIALRVLETQGIRIRVQNSIYQPVELRVPSDNMDQAVPLYTGDLIRETVGSFSRFSGITIERFQPTPATILAIIPTVEVSPR